MSFAAMAGAGATFLTALGASGAGATIGGAALAGGALGAGTGAIGAAATGGDVTKGALMGAGTGALTAGVGSAAAAPAATAATTGIQEGIKTTAITGIKEGLQQGAQQGLQQGSALLNPVKDAGGQVINQGTSLAAGQTASQLANQGAQQGLQQGWAGSQSALLNPVKDAGGQVINPATSLPSGAAAAPGSSAAPVGSEVATNVFGGAATPLTTAESAGIAGLSRTGIGLASGEDLEGAGTAGITSAGLVGLSSGLGDLSTTPVAELTAEGGAANAVSATPDVRAGFNQLAENFGTYDAAASSLGEVAVPGVATVGGLAATDSMNQYKEDLGDYDRYRQGKEDKYDATVQNIKDSYAAAGVEVPTGIGGSPLWGGYYAEGGIAGLTKGEGDGTGDKIPAVIDGKQPAALSTDEFVIPADVVSHIGNGSTTAGAKTLYAMMDDIRRARTKSSKQPKDINPAKYMPA